MSDFCKKAFIFLLFTVSQFCSYRVGVEEFQMGRYNDAIKSFQAAIGKEDSVGNSYYFIGKILSISDNDGKAFQSFLKAFQSKANHPDLVSDFGQCLNRMASSQFFELAYREQILIAPVVHHFAYQLYQKKEVERLFDLMERAENSPLFQQSISSFPNNAGMCFYFMAYIYFYDLKDMPKALEYSRKAMIADTNLQTARSLNRSAQDSLRKDLEAVDKEALEYFNNRNFDQAREVWAKALLLKPDDRELQDKMEKCRIAKFSFDALAEAEKLLEAGHKNEAMNKLQFASQFPENLRAKVLLERLEQEAQSLAHSLEAKIQTEADNRNSFNQLLREAENLLQRDQAADIQLAIDKYQQAHQIYSADEQVQNNLQRAQKRLSLRRYFDEAQSLFQQHKNKEALAIADKLMKEDAGFPGLGFLFLSILSELQDFEQVISLGEELLKQYPNNKEILLRVAQAYEVRRHDLSFARDKAIEKYKLLLAIAPNEPGAALSLSMLQKEKYIPLLIITMFFMVVIFIVFWLYKTKDKRRKFAFENNFQSLYDRKDFKGVCRLYQSFYEIDLTQQETIRLQPQFMAAMVECAEFDEAMEIGRRVLAANPNHKQVLNLMARCCYAKRVFTQGILRYYIDFFDTGNPTPDMVEFVGEKLFELGFESKETLNIMRTFNKLFPEHEKCRHVLLSIFAGEKTIDKQVLDLMISEVQQNPTDTKFRLRLADYYLQRKQFDDCIHYCEEVINLNPTERALHHILFEAYHQQNLLTDLMPIYETLFETYPNDIFIQEMRAKIKLRLSGLSLDEEHEIGNGSDEESH